MLHTWHCGREQTRSMCSTRGEPSSPVPNSLSPASPRNEKPVCRCCSRYKRTAVVDWWNQKTPPQKPFQSARDSTIDGKNTSFFPWGGAARPAESACLKIWHAFGMVECDRWSWSGVTPSRFEASQGKTLPVPLYGAFSTISSLPLTTTVEAQAPDGSCTASSPP